MRTLMLAVVLLAVGIAGVGYYRGWFAFSTKSADQMPSATITVDKNKFHEDEQKAKEDVQGAEQKTKEDVQGAEQKAKEDVQGAEQKAKEEFENLTGKAKQPQRQP